MSKRAVSNLMFLLAAIALVAALGLTWKKPFTVPERFKVQLKGSGEVYKSTAYGFLPRFSGVLHQIPI